MIENNDYMLIDSLRDVDLFLPYLLFYYHANQRQMIYLPFLYHQKISLTVFYVLFVSLNYIFNILGKFEICVFYCFCNSWSDLIR